MVMPIIIMTAKVPIRDTGMATVGIRVGRQSPRKIKVISTTSATACIREVTTWLMATFT